MQSNHNSVKKLFSILKTELRMRSITYKDIALKLNTSEVSVKRWFSNERLTIDQLSKIVDLMGLTLAELLQKTAAPPLRRLSNTQETKIVSDVKLLLIGICIFDNWTVEEIIETYRISRSECIKYLITLDKLRLIDLLPENRIRILVARGFDWLPGGPIYRLFYDRLFQDFLSCDFKEEFDDRQYMRARLTPAAIAQFRTELQELRRRMSELHEECLKAPADQRHTVTAVFAQREWEPDEFSALRRHPPAASP